MTEQIPPELEYLGRFHGHLGPYAVVGYKMGTLAREKLGDEWMSAVVYTGLVKPLSCVIDGIQVSTPCTLGKGNIKVEDGKIPKAAFKSAGKKLVLFLKEEVWKKIDREMSKDKELEHSLYYFNMPNEELLDISDVLDIIE